jgi:hypothetical protein
MFRKKRARSVIHSIVHHGVSALSWLHPRLGEECANQNLEYIEINLLEAAVSTNGFTASEETKSAINSLKETFSKIAASEGIDITELAEATIKFGFEKGKWPSICVAKMNDKNNISVSVKVDGFGNKYSLLSKYAYKYS